MKSMIPSSVNTQLQKIIAEHGDQTDWDHLKYNGVLYPDEAIVLLSLSRSQYWPNYNIDKLLESCVSNWLNKKEITAVYIDDLLLGIKNLNCLEGVLLRLNLATVAKPFYDQTSKITAAIRGEPRNKIKEYFKSKRKFLDINNVYRMLENINNQYNSEQSLLSWLGYVVIRKILELDHNSDILQKI